MENLQLPGSNLTSLTVKNISIFRSVMLAGMMSILAAGTEGCNEATDPVVVEDSLTSGVVVTKFNLQDNSSIQVDLDTVFFTIDLDNYSIYNADSLPKGTPVDKLKIKLSFLNTVDEAKIVMTGGDTRTGEVDYKLRPSEEIDFTGKVQLNVKSENGLNSASYFIKVNVHKQDPDTIMWDKLGVAELPSRMPAPIVQRSVSFDSKMYVLLQESDASYTLSINDNPAEKMWTKTALSLPFTPVVRSFTATSTSFYVLSSDGSLYSSTDGNSWTSTGETWLAINAAYEDGVVGLTAGSAGLMHDRYPRPPGYVSKVAAADFPVKQFSGWGVQESKWASGPMVMIAGGITSNGDYSNAVWGFDGYNWAKISTALPAVAGPVMANYYYYRLMTSTSIVPTEVPVLIFTGGMDASGVLNKKVYMSYDFGVNWTECPALAQLPDYIEPRYEADLLVINKTLSASLSAYWKEMPSKDVPDGKTRTGYAIKGDVLEWKCPYLYMIGGRNAEGALCNQIWKGVLNRLEFTPLF